MEIKGSQFTLRGLRKEDAPSIQKHADNPNVPPGLFERFPSPYTLADAEFFINLKADKLPVTSFAIEVDGEAVGVISLEYRADVYRKSPLVGYWLGEEYWGRGIMPEAVNLITEYGFNNLDIMCIMAGVFGTNPKSMRVLEKAGYTKQAILKQCIFKNGEVLDEHIYVRYNLTPLSC